MRILARTATLLLLAPVLAGTLALPAAAQGPMNATETTMTADGVTYANWVVVGLSSPFGLDGRQAHYMQRHRIPGGPFAGISDLYLERFIGADGILSLSGRAIYDNHDYRLRLGYEHFDLGFARAGFRSFRTWYDGGGGFFAPSETWFEPWREQLAMDRGEAFVEAGLRAPDVPQLTLSYARQFRSGQKPSLAWGETNLTEGLGTRRIVPAFWDTDEVRHMLEGRARHTLGLADLRLGLRYERADINNSRNALRRPDEAPERRMTQHEGSLSGLLHGHAISTLRLRENVRLTASYAFTTQSGELSGSRIFGADYGAAYDPLFPGRQQRDAGFVDLAGTTEIRHHTARLNLAVRPWSNLTIVPSVRLEKRDLDVSLTYVDTYVGNPPALDTRETPHEGFNQRSLIDVAGDVDVRYTGIRNLTLYTRGAWLEGTGDLTSRQLESATGETLLLRTTDDRRSTQRYTVGANWHPLPGVNVGLQAFRRYRSLSFEHVESPRGPGRYPAFLTAQDLTTDNFNVRLRWRGTRALTFSARYDYQRITVGAEAAEMEHLRTADIRRQVFSHGVNWSPTPRFYVQAHLSYAVDRSTTPPNRITDAAAGLVEKARNDYLSATVSARHALSNRVDMEFDYFTYRADNFVDSSEVSLPLGADCREHGLAGGMSLQVNDRVRLNARYLFFLHRDKTAGGQTDYDVHLVHTGIQYRF